MKAKYIAYVLHLYKIIKNSTSIDNFSVLYYIYE